MDPIQKPLHNNRKSKDNVSDMEQNKMVDVFRFLNPESKEYTLRKTKPLKQHA